MVAVSEQEFTDLDMRAIHAAAEALDLAHQLVRQLHHVVGDRRTSQKLVLDAIRESRECAALCAELEDRKHRILNPPKEPI